MIQTKTKAFITLGLLVLLSFPLTVKAQDPGIPEKRIFYVTGYYSPLEGQSFYLRGTLEAEKRLNGNGIKGASGQPVYSGMLAAPKSYPFGTKIKLEGVGIGTVHDRGGAIVQAGERNYSFDRLDIWMGYGEEGLKRALSWGIRKVIGYVYPPGSQVANTIDVDHFYIIKKNWPQGDGLTLFTRNLGRGSTGEDVQRLQEVLVELGYLNTDPTQSYDMKTIDAVYRFQVDNKIIKKDTEVGAGYTGQKTRAALEKQWYERKEEERKQQAVLKTEKQNFTNTFPVNLGKRNGTRADIEILQRALKDIGYDITVSGGYDQATYRSVLDFQIKKGIVSSDKEYGAGYFGGQTKLFLVEDVWTVRHQKQQEIQPAASSPVASPTSIFSGKTLQVKSSGKDVTALQEILVDLGYFQAIPTGYYGPKTKEAVTIFQIANGLAADTTTSWAGVCGPVTQKKIEEVHQLFRGRKITDELDKGDKGIEVAKVQSILKKTGYFEGDITGVFGSITKDAIYQFQLDHNIIEGPETHGAGRVGQTTLKILNETLKSVL